MRGARRALLVAIAAVMLVAVLPGAAVAEKTIGITAAKFDFSLAAGSAGSGELYVVNDGDEPLTVMVYAASQKVEADGKIEYTIPGRDDRTGQAIAATWVRFRLPAETKTVGNTPYLELKPGSRVLVEFEVVVPSSAPPGDSQVILFFEMFDLDQANSGTGSAVGGRIGSRLRIRVQGKLVERIDIKPFVVSGLVVGDVVPYTFVVVNEGNIDKSLNVSGAILDRNEVEKISSALVTDTPVYAASRLEKSGSVPAKGLIGRYTLRLTAEYPTEGADAPAQQLTKDRTFWILPWWLVIAVTAVLGAGILTLSWRQAVVSARRRSAARRVPSRATPDYRTDTIE